MARMPFIYTAAEERKRERLSPFLLFAMMLAVMAFCTTLWLR
jgi:hypothetical protein